MTNKRAASVNRFTATKEYIAGAINFLIYPDISIVCGDIQTFNNDEWNVTNPH